MKPKVIIQTGDEKWLFFENPVKILAARTLEEVLPVVREAFACGAKNLWAAGYICYEAAAAFDNTLKTKQPDGQALPLAWFALYDKVCRGELPPAETDVDFDIKWQPDTLYAKYSRNIGKIKALIEKGDTYQVNYTIRLNADFKYNPFDFFINTARSSNAQYCCFIETEHLAVCSFSPELFFSYDNGAITAKPVKGTIARAASVYEDIKAKDRLSQSIKDKAENVMIVDMLRNDLGRIAEAGSVEVPQLFTIEKYPTLYQMSSTITAKTNVNLADIITRIFPCASITGAPKRRTMDIIADIETTPRGIYTGTICSISPDGTALFNVAIRTAVIDKTTGKAVYGTGSGIVWDSSAKSEYAECMTKSQVLSTQTNFSLLESLLWCKRDGFSLEGRHIRRLAASAEYFDFKFDKDSILRALYKSVSNLDAGVYKIRLLLHKNGRAEAKAQSIELSDKPLTVTLSQSNIDSRDVFVYHKTTNRRIYDKALSLHPNADEVILWNEKRQITECCFHNIIFEKDSKLYTPPVKCGLLNGTLRQEMLDNGTVQEKIITTAELEDYDNIYLINSVRGKRKAVLLQRR